MFGPFVHSIDPVIFSVGGVHVWWYGLSFTLGFLNAHLFLRRNRERVGLSLSAAYDLTLLLAAGVLVGGRAREGGRMNAECGVRNAEWQRRRRGDLSHRIGFHLEL
jgi:hypothetical protein